MKSKKKTFRFSKEFQWKLNALCVVLRCLFGILKGKWTCVMTILFKYYLRENVGKGLSSLLHCSMLYLCCCHVVKSFFYFLRKLSMNIDFFFVFSNFLLLLFLSKDTWNTLKGNVTKNKKIKHFFVFSNHPTIVTQPNTIPYLMNWIEPNRHLM